MRFSREVSCQRCVSLAELFGVVFGGAKSCFTDLDDLRAKLAGGARLSLLYFSDAFGERGLELRRFGERRLHAAARFLNAFGETSL